MKLRAKDKDKYKPWVDVKAKGGWLERKADIFRFTHDVELFAKEQGLEDGSLVEVKGRGTYVVHVVKTFKAVQIRED